MQPQIKQSQIVLKVSENIGDFPATFAQIEEAIKHARIKYPQLSAFSQEQIREKVITSNMKMIQWQFLDTMHRVLRKIEPEIKHYPEHKSIKYLQSIIYEHLDSNVFASVRISKIRNKLLGNALQDEQMTVTDKLFTELLAVMNQLLQIMKQFYGFPRDDQISGVVFQCISVFVMENQNCFLVQQDKKTQSQIKNGKISETKTQEKPRKKSQGAIKIAQNLIGSLLTQIKHVNPFGDKAVKLQQHKKLEQRKTILKQYENIPKRQTLNQETIKIVLKLRNMSSPQIIKTMSNSQKAEFTSVIFDALQAISKNSSSTSKISKIRNIQKEIGEMVEEAIGYNEQLVDEQLQKNKEIKWITLLFKAFQKQYHIDSERRKWLLRFCESQYVSKRLHNPFSVIKILQSEKIQQSQVLKSLRNLPKAQKIDQTKKIDPTNKKEVQAHLTLEHELNRIHLFEFKKKYAKEPHLEFQRLTDSKRRVVTFLFSGFLSEDTDKVQEWSGLLNNFYDSQVYSVRWQSKTVKGMMEFVFKSATDLGPAQSVAMLGGPYLKAIAIMHHLYQKFQQNPFHPAYESAITTGQYMAQFIMNNFKGYFINLVGFSLGTEVIKSIMKRMAQKKCLNMLNKVYLLGGVADKTEMQTLIQSSPYPLHIVNLHSDNDYILKYLLRLCRSDITPIGLNPIKHIEGHTIKNQDCKYFVQGHMSYRSNLQFFAKYLKMADD